MFFTNKFKKFYIFFFAFVLSISIFSISKLHANSFKITEIEVSEDFNLNFDKKKVFDIAFKKAFAQLISTVITSKDIKKLKKTNLSTIKSLIDSFNVSNEKFIGDKYFAKINVHFNKKNTYNYFESKNIFPSIPNKLNLLILPILVNNKEEIVYYGENPIYKNWNINKQKHHLLNYILPTEDIEDRQILKKKVEFIEEYKFDQIIQKYDLPNYIILIINQNNNGELNILSKLQLNNSYKIFNSSYNEINIYEEQKLLKLIIDLKTLYEDEWKKLNLINTSIKLPLTLSLSSKDYDKIKLFENVLENLDLVSNFVVLSFNNKEIFYKVIYNGSPDKFFHEMKNKGLSLEKNNQAWKIQ